MVWQHGCRSGARIESDSALVILERPASSPADPVTRDANMRQASGSFRVFFL